MFDISTGRRKSGDHAVGYSGIVVHAYTRVPANTSSINADRVNRVVVFDRREHHPGALLDISTYDIYDGPCQERWRWQRPRRLESFPEKYISFGGVDTNTPFGVEQLRFEKIGLGDRSRGLSSAECDTRYIS